MTQVRRIRHTRMGDSFTDIAFLLIVASAILKISYKGTIQAEVKAAEATETAESEQLKRQVVEARMAAMQAQVEPHFLFNTLASIDHLIQTDPSRASQMQKNLIALLRASMPSMRESTPMAHNLGREMAVIRPYLEILKVRMEERLQTDIQVPDGLLSAEFPSMMIQSLVENAIKHGLEPKAEGGKISVKAEIVHGKLAVTVADTGLGFGKAATAGTGVGLANIRERHQAALRRPRLDDGGGQHAERHHRHPHRALPGATAGRSDRMSTGWRWTWAAGDDRARRRDCDRRLDRRGLVGAAARSGDARDRRREGEPAGRERLAGDPGADDGPPGCPAGQPDRDRDRDRRGRLSGSPLPRSSSP